MTVYKIRHRRTGLYCKGGSHPRWHKTGKTWNTLAHVKSHLTWVRNWPDLANFYNEAVVELELVDKRVIYVPTILTEAVTERMKKEAEMRARAAADERARDLRDLERLKAKLGV